MYEVLMDKWSIGDIHELDISFFCRLMDRRIKEKEKERLDDIEAFYNKI